MQPRTCEFWDAESNFCALHRPFATQTNDSNVLNAMDCISRRKAVSAISDLLMLELKGKRLPTWNEVYRAINAVPSAQPERKQGEWTYHSNPAFGINAEDAYCSCCNYHIDTTMVDFDDYNFCPNCGADMRKETEDEL